MWPNYSKNCTPPCLIYDHTWCRNPCRNPCRNHPTSNPKHKHTHTHIHKHTPPAPLSHHNQRIDHYPRALKLLFNRQQAQCHPCHRWIHLRCHVLINQKRMPPDLRCGLKSMYLWLLLSCLLYIYYVLDVLHLYLYQSGAYIRIALYWKLIDCIFLFQY